MAEELNFFTDGAAYERLMRRWSALAGDIFLDWLALPKRLRWLDVECGNGAFTERILARFAPAEVHALDPSESQIAYARTRPGARLAQFRQGDAQALPFGDAAFDVAAMALVIIFVPNPAKAVGEMSRVVRSGGCAAAYMWDILDGGLPGEPIRAALASMGLAMPPPPGSEASRLNDMRRLWKEAGLDAIESREIEVQITYRDFDDFWQSNLALPTPAKKRIDEMSLSEVEQLQGLLRERLPTDPQGHISFAARANAVKGQVPA